MNIILVDDSTVVRVHLTTLLSTNSGAQIVGHATSEDEAFELIAAKQPNLTVLDISLEQGTGINLLRRMQLAGVTAHSVMLTNETSSHCRNLSLTHGAGAYFDKSMDLELLVNYIKLLMIKQSFMS